MMMNYPTAMIKLSEYDKLDKKTKRNLLEKALTIAEFHEFDRLTIYIRKLLKDK